MGRGKRWGVFFAIGVFLLPGCSEDPLAELKDAEEFTLYSILGDPRPPPPGTPAPTSGENLHGWPVIGKTNISDPQKRKAIVNSLQSAVATGKSRIPMAKCFDPRHAIRVKRYGMTVDYLICFECLRVRKYWFSWGAFTQGDDMSTKQAPQKTLNFYLKEAGIALDPAMKGEI